MLKNLILVILTITSIRICAAEDNKSTLDKASEKAHELKDKASEKAHELKDKISEKLHDLKTTKAQNLNVSNAWFREGAAGDNSALYLSVTNKNPQDLHLIAVETDIAESTGIHQSIFENGVVKMIPIDKLTIPAGKTIELKPQDIHIMLMGLNKSFKLGNKANFTLKFDDNSALEFGAIVKNK